MNRRTVIAGAAATLAASAMPSLISPKVAIPMGDMRVYAPLTADKIIAGYKSAWGINVSHLREWIDKVIATIHEFEASNGTPFPIAALLPPYPEDESGVIQYPIIYRENGDPLDWRQDDESPPFRGSQSIPDDPRNDIEGNRILALGFRDAS